MKSKAQATDNGVMKDLVGASLEYSLQEKFLELRKLFHDMGAVLVAFSGGIDSTLVLKLAHDSRAGGGHSPASRQPLPPPT